jgi:5,6-dimethylbenzimidazole synthase
MEAKLRARHPDFDPTFRDQLQALLAWRRDVRRFRRDALPQGTIERLIEIACLSPSVV